jgi:hypothetical protein
MSRTPSNFRQTDVTRALKAVRVAGCGIARILIGKDGRIEIITTPAATEAGAEGTDDLDCELEDWEERRGRKVSP